MERPSASLQWVGSPCGSHGSYIFYKAFQCRLKGSARILCLGDFFPVRCQPGAHPACIAELQLLWEDTSSGQRLSSSKLYFLPEDTPQGRGGEHGQDEVIAVSEKVIVKLQDLVKWAQHDFSKWKCGLQALPVPCKEWKNGQKDAFLKHRQLTLNGGLNFKDVLKEKFDLGENEDDANVIVLSYPQYCRYRSMLKRIQAKSSSLLLDQFVLALGGIAVRNKNTHIFYCRETFDHPRLIENEKICDKFAPNLKGRPRKKKPLAQRRDSCGAVKECPGHSDSRAVAKVKNEAKSSLLKPKSSSSTCKKAAEDRPKVAPGEEDRAAEQAFLVGLYKYMKDRKTPIERIPYLGFKQINLWTLFQAAHKLGGYETITARRQWKHVYDELGGNPGSTSAATCTRRHYERLLLPYERFMKGEEDKPLPPVKPRKQEQSPPEADMKTEVLEAKQMKAVSKKGKKEKNSAQEAQKDTEASLKQEESLETAEEGRALPDPPAALEQLKTLPQGIAALAADASQLVAVGKIDMSEANCSRDILKEEATDEEKIHVSKDLTVLKAEQESAPTDEHSERKREGSPSTKQEQFLQSCTGPVEKEPKVPLFSMYHDSQVHGPNRNCAEDDYLPQLPDYVANCTLKMDALGTGDSKSPMDSNILKTALRQNTKVYVVQSLDVLKQNEQPVTRNENPTVSYAPLLYSRGNPGIMSPLAKKKLLSQVSGVSVSSSYPYGSPPALISKKRPNGRDEAPSSGLQATPGCSTESAAINRPSVIQHVQSFKTKFDEDRPPTSDCIKQGSSSKVDTHCCDFTKLHQSSLADSSVIKPETAKKARAHYRVTSLLSDFYSSPHLHSLYKQAEHHLHSGQSTKLFSRDIFGESESSSSRAQQKHQEKRNLIYNPPFQHQEKHPVEESSTDDQPTDLSMPKPLNKHSTAVQELSLPDTVGQHEKKPLYIKYKSENNQTLSSECSNPKACRVSPMVMSPAKKLSEKNPRSGPSHNLKLDGLRQLEGTVHSVAGSKTVNIGTARPLKRSMEELPNNTSEKKIRIVSPLHLSKETAEQETFSHQGGERSKSVHDSHSDSRLESHRYPGSSPISSGLYAGSLCSGLNYHIPSSHSIPIHHLKIQNLYSQVMPPTTLQSFMAQRHLLASSANSQQLYRHLAAGTPAGSPYIDLLYNNIYPLASISPQNAFPPSQLSSVHPSTKL